MFIVNQCQWKILFALFCVIVPSTISAQNCNSSFTAIEKPNNLTSPGYPNYYTTDPQYDCNYTINTTDPEHIIVFKFNSFEFPKLSNNYLRIAGFWNSSIAQFYGFSNARPPNIYDEYILPLTQGFVQIVKDKTANVKFSMSFYSTTTKSKAKQIVATDLWEYLPTDISYNTTLYNVVANNSLGILMFKLARCHGGNSTYLKFFNNGIFNPILEGSCEELMQRGKFNISTNDVFIFIFNTGLHDASLNVLQLSCVMFVDPNSLATSTTTTTDTLVTVSEASSFNLNSLFLLTVTFALLLL